MKVFVVGGNIYYANWIKDVELTTDLEKAQMVFFTGGEDVDPSFYQCKKHPSTFSNPARDEMEFEVFHNIRPEQLVIGVCRGLN